MTPAELIALAKSLGACEEAIVAAAHYTDLATFCRDNPDYAAWMINTKDFWDRLGDDQRAIAVDAEPGQAIECKHAWDWCDDDRKRRCVDAEPWYAIMYQHAWDWCDDDRKRRCVDAATGYAIYYKYSREWMEKRKTKGK